MEQRLGRYTLIRRLAAGGMGEVFLAETEGPAGFRKRVVVKQLLPQFAGQQDFVQMLLDEARLAARLNHPCITHTFELGEANGGFYVAMEYVDGASLATLLHEARKAKTGVPAEVALQLALELVRALEYAHTLTDDEGRPLGIVHRDVTPSNVMLTRDGALKLLDFGLARATTHQHRTDAGIVKGKVGYMAPEQCVRSDVDARADIFATGAVLYELTVGRGPFNFSEPHLAWNAMATATFDKPSSVSPGFSPQLEAILVQALERSPEDRQQSARELRMQLESFARSAGIFPNANAVAEWVRSLIREERPPAPTEEQPAPPRLTVVAKRKAEPRPTWEEAPPVRAPTADGESALGKTFVSMSGSAPGPGRSRTGPAIVAVLVIACVGVAWKLFGRGGTGDAGVVDASVGGEGVGVALGNDPMRVQQDAGTSAGVAVNGPDMDGGSLAINGTADTRVEPDGGSPTAIAHAETNASPRHPKTPLQRLDSEVKDLRRVYSALTKRVGGEQSLTAIERQTYAYAIEESERARRDPGRIPGALKALEDARRILQDAGRSASP